MRFVPCGEDRERLLITALSTNDETAAAVSETVARLFLDKFGKGPLHVETHVSGDLLLTLMRDVFTVAEQSLIADGRQGSVLNNRMLWQHATESMFKDAVAAVTGRRVLTVISGFEVDAGIATEVFILAPR